MYETGENSQSRESADSSAGQRTREPKRLRIQDIEQQVTRANSRSAGFSDMKGSWIGMLPMSPMTCSLKGNIRGSVQ
jgi:hypothetical protein